MKYKSAPLPFQGQKRNFRKELIQIFQSIPNNGERFTILDVFGGSGFCSYLAKQSAPKAQVIYNDFDDYTQRIKNIHKTEQLRKELFQLIGQDKEKSKLNPEQKEEIIQILKKQDYLDIQTIQTWLMFTGKTVNTQNELFSQSFYNKIPKKTYQQAEDYLDGINIVSQPFQTLIPKYKNTENLILILDPPYLFSDHKRYKNSTTFGIVDFLNMLHLTTELNNPSILFFNHDESKIIELIDFFKETKNPIYQIFKEAKTIQKQTTFNKCVKYRDNLIYSPKF